MSEQGFQNTCVPCVTFSSSLTWMVLSTETASASLLEQPFLYTVALSPGERSSYLALSCPNPTPLGE